MLDLQGINLKNKLPPHNIEAELAVLGAILLDSEAFGVIRPILAAEAFYSPQHQKIYKAISDLDARGEKFDILILSDELRSSGELDSVGGPGYVASLTDSVPSSANVEFYARIVLEGFVRRSLLRASSKISVSAFDETVPTRSVLEEAQKTIFELTDAGKSAEFKQLKEIIKDAVTLLEDLQKKQGNTGIASGFEDLDSMTYGFQDAEFIIIGARPSVGKTALAMTMASHIAINKNIPTAFFSLEMSEMQLTQRLISARSRINSNKLRSANLSAKDYETILNTMGELYEAPFYIADMPNMKLLDLRALARKLCGEPYNVKVIFIDYLSLITSENPMIPRHEQIAEVSRSLKSLARELNIPVIALSQLRRDAEGKQPGLSDLRESGSLEQDADVVMFLHRERSETKDDNSIGIETDLIVAKQRNGPIGTVKLLFKPQFTTFVSKTKGN